MKGASFVWIALLAIIWLPLAVFSLRKYYRAHDDIREARKILEKMHGENRHSAEGRSIEQALDRIEAIKD